MSFDMQRLPPQKEPDEEKRLMMWAIGYLFIAAAYTIAGWVLIIKHRVGLGVICFIAGWVALHYCNKRTEEAKRYKRFHDE